MNDTTTKLLLPFIAPSQAQKHVTHNEGLQILDAVTQLSVQSLTVTSPPSDPLDGQSWYIASPATGAWQSQDGKLAVWQTNTWAFLQLGIGWRAWVKEEAILKVWDGESWQPISGSDQAQDPEPFSELGLNATADSTNRFSLRSPASLFSHEGSDHRLNINKQESTDTSSILFQTDFSARAEVGLTGNDNLNIKVSPDGATWHTALVIDAEDGRVSLPGTSGRVAVALNEATRLEPAVRMSGTARDGSEDVDEGVGLFLTHNGTNNRQFVLADTQSIRGVRFLGSAIDGYSNGARTDLNLGTNTHGVHVGVVISNTQFSASNHVGTQTKTVASIAGHETQTGDLIYVSTQHTGTQGDALKIRADKVSEFGGPLKLASHSVSSLPSAGDIGSLIYVGDESGGGVPAFSDGTNWRRVTDRAIIS